VPVEGGPHGGGCAEAGEATDVFYGHGGRLQQFAGAVDAGAVLWPEVNLDDATVNVTSTVIRVKGRGLIRKVTKSEADKRLLPLPTWR
jgi:hypothetical protein